MAEAPKTPKQQADLAPQQVLEYLKAHPGFLNDHPELFTLLTPPAQNLGENVVDLQHYMLGNLQKNIQSLREKYDGLIVSCRDNMSTQAQVHEAVLGLMRTRDLEQLIEVITQDLVRLFDVDVVRLAVESPAAELYETYYGDQNYSGISFIEPGLVDIIAGRSEPVLLSDDTRKKFIPGFDQVFADCHGMVRSCAMLRLTLDQTGRDALLAFGVRHAGHFHPGQGFELLSFLARIVEHKLDASLYAAEPQLAL